jgi:hypothetical protein
VSPFFIGWLGLPPGLRRFIGVVLALLALIDGGLAALLFWAQPSRSNGFWDPAGRLVIEGELVRQPYPLLRVPAAGEHPAYSVLLTEEWKFGVPLGAEFTDGDWVRVSGYAIRRGDATVLQLDADPTRLGHTPPALPALRTVGERRIEGEIVDAKCWTGAMNPGEGKSHKGCGSLCLLGEVPALFVPSDPRDGPRWYVIADRAGASLGEGLRARLGERLILTGEILEAPDLHELRVDADALLP